MFTKYFPFVHTRDINPDVQFEVNNYNITLVDNFVHFMEVLK